MMKQPPPTGQPPSRSPRRRHTAVLLLIVLALCGYLFTQRDVMREHLLYFTTDRKDVTFELTELSEEWTEKTLRERFAGLSLQCFPNPGAGLGDTGCTLDTKSFNGIPTLFISFFFSSGHLQQISANVLWWKHAEAHDYLVTTLGPPKASQLLPFGGVRLHGWQLPDGGAVFLNRDKALSPLGWNSIYWRSASLCATRGCFTTGRN